MNIKIIGAVPFIRYLRKEREVEIFSISLREINKKLKGKEVKKKVIIPLEYQDLADFFLKKVLDILSSYRLYNHRIKLKEEYYLFYAPLYKLMREELIAAKAYIKKNLAKRFIEVSRALYTALILFSHKKDSSLYRTVDCHSSYKRRGSG